MSLTDTTIRTAKPGEKPAKLSDEKRLCLLMSLTGGKMMQQWADYLDKLNAGAEVIPLHQSA